MDFLANLGLGFGVALSMPNMLSAFLGVALGLVTVALPGLGPVATISLLLPVIYSLNAVPALVMLAGVYYGARHGGSIAAILSRVEGEPGAPATAVDGQAMARQGRAGAALAVVAAGAFLAGSVGTLVVAAGATPLTELAYRFGPAEYFSLMVLGLIAAVVLALGSMMKALAMAILGILLAQLKREGSLGSIRYGLDIPELGDGIGFVVIAMGVFVLSEVISRLAEPAEGREILTRDVTLRTPLGQDFADAWPAVLRGTSLGAVLGAIPGGGTLLASFAAYSLETRIAGRGGAAPFGRGNVRGVAAPESAAHAGAQTSFIPMLTLGIPPNAAMALLVGAMAIKGVQLGPQVMTGSPQLFWGLLASMWIGNVMLLLLDLSLIRLWLRLLAAPYGVVYPAVILLSCVGVYSLNHNSFDLYVSGFFALVGYVFHKLRCEAAPLLLGFILAPTIEENLRRALSLSGGDWSVFVMRPLSAALLASAVLTMLLVMLPSVGKRRDAAALEE